MNPSWKTSLQYYSTQYCTVHKGIALHTYKYLLYVLAQYHVGISSCKVRTRSTYNLYVLYFTSITVYASSSCSADELVVLTCVVQDVRGQQLRTAPLRRLRVLVR
jgi:hypothetical protein